MSLGYGLLKYPMGVGSRTGYAMGVGSGLLGYPISGESILNNTVKVTHGCRVCLR